MKIKLVICANTLGESNTNTENQRYTNAVKVNITALYPSADVDVSLSGNPCDAVCDVTGGNEPHDYDAVTDSNIDVAEHVGRIASSVWDRGEY